MSACIVLETHADGYISVFRQERPDQTPVEAYDAMRHRYQAHGVKHTADPYTLTLTVPMTELDGVARTKTLQFVAADASGGAT